MYYVCILCMIKARIRWCTYRVDNILTLGKLLSLWFCFLLHSILFLISQTSYRTYKIISSYELTRPIMGTIFSGYTTVAVALHSLVIGGDQYFKCSSFLLCDCVRSECNILVYVT